MDNTIPNIGQSLKEFQLTKDSKSKLSYDWGKKVAKDICASVYGANSYFFYRNSRFYFNRNLANGRVDVEAMYRDKLDFVGKHNYISLSWKAPAIIATTISGLIGNWLNRKEKIEVQAIDAKSLSTKKEIENKAIAYFETKDVLKELEAASGQKLIPQDQFVAEDKNDLDEWVTEINRLPEEIKYELHINNIFEQNGFYDVIKEKFLTDSTEVGLVCSEVVLLDNGEIALEYLKPEDCFYSYSIYPDFRDTSWRGVLKTFKIKDLRSKYGKEYGGTLSEEDIFKIAATSKQYQYYSNLTWQDSFNYSFLRPYDDFNVVLVNFCIRSVDYETNTITKSDLGKTYIKEGANQVGNSQILTDKRRNIYKGVYHQDTGIMLEWGLQKRMIRPQDPKEIGDVEFPYSFYMYKNYDMRNLAIPEKIEQPVEQMILIGLQIQKLIAGMTPAGAAVNIAAMQELFLGIGDAATTPQEADRIFRQTGRLYYNGKDADGNPIPMPITEMPNNGFSAQLQTLIGAYQFQHQVIKDQLGEDLNLGTMAAQPRVTEGNIQVATQMADFKTDYMYDAYVRLIEDMSRKVACLLNTSVTYGAKKYREIFKEEEVKDRNFATKMKLLPTQQEILLLQQQMQTAVASNPNVPIYVDTYKILRIAKENIKLANDYYRRSMEKMIKTERETAQQNAQQNAQIQTQSIQAKAESDAQLLQQKIDLESQLEDLRAKNKEREIVLSGIFGLYQKGLQVPNELKQVEMGMIQNIVVPLMADNIQQQAQIAQGMQEQQQAMQQPQQPQENQQEEMDEEQMGTQEAPMQEQMEYQ